MSLLEAVKKAVVFDESRGAGQGGRWKYTPEWDTEPGFMGKVFLTLLLIRELESYWSAVQNNDFFKLLQELKSEYHGVPTLLEIDREISRFEKEGWRWGVDLEVANHFTMAISPTGEKSCSYYIRVLPEPMALAYVAKATANTEEEKNLIRRRYIANNIGHAFLSFGPGATVDWDAPLTDVVTFFKDGHSETLHFGRKQGLEPRFMSAWDVEGRGFEPHLLKICRIEVRQTLANGCKTIASWEDRGN